MTKDVCPLCIEPLRKLERVVVDLESNTVILDNKLIYLTPHFAIILDALASAQPRLISTPFLMDAIYGLESDEPDQKIIGVHMFHLRKRIKRTNYRIINQHTGMFRLIRLSKEERNNEPKRVILESPYAGDVEKNRLYALECLRDMFSRGEAPFASHLLYPPILIKWTQEERKNGIKAGLSWYQSAELCAVYVDNGITEGMKLGISTAKSLRVKIEYRKLPKNAD